MNKMKHLVNYCPIDYYEKTLQGQDLGAKLKAIGLDGIEQFVYQEEVGPVLYKDLTKGVHLKYWPYWLDFYLGKASYYNDFQANAKLDQVYWQAKNPEEWIGKIKNHLLQVQKYEPEYLVWHVAQADDTEIFTYDFKYSSKEVLDHTLTVVNEVAKVLSPDVELLFENLWWPGLTLLEPALVEYFFSRLSHPKVGIMLDTGHLMNTNPQLKTQDQGLDYIMQVVRNLGANGSMIKGFHLNASLSGEYLSNVPKQVPANCDSTKIWQHITSIDQHKPFTTTKVKELVELVQPKHITHELAYDTIEEMLQLVKAQRECCLGIKNK